LILAIAAASGLAYWGCAENGSLMDACGDGIIAGTDPCDDGNTASGDGCSVNCKLEPGFVCVTQGSVPNSVCHRPTCGDGLEEGFEQCDDGNLTPGDGCSASCTVESPTGIQPTLASIQQYVFSPICASCHYPGGSIPSLNSIEISYAELVNVESFFCSNGSGGYAKRVEPYQPDASCLVMVIEGAQGAGGLSMPPSPIRPLNADQKEAIREWITLGAAP